MFRYRVGVLALDVALSEPVLIAGEPAVLFAFDRVVGDDASRILAGRCSRPRIVHKPYGAGFYIRAADKFTRLFLRRRRSVPLHP